MSNADRDKESKRNQILVGVVLILLMLFSTVGFAFSFGISGNVVEEIEYNGIDFAQDPNNGYWTFEVNGKQFYTVYNPEEVAEINFVNPKTVGNYANKPLYFVGEAGDSFSELYRTLSEYVLRVGGACLDDTCEEDYPLKSCGVDNVVIIEEIFPNEDGEFVGEEEIVTDANCVYIKAKPQNLVRYVDAYLFSLLGIK